MNFVKTRGCPYCGSYTVFDRVRYLDANGAETVYTLRVSLVESAVCLTCKQPYPLGPSNDLGCDVEIQAAILAAERGEPFGYDSFDYCPHSGEDLCDLCQAFYLAHEINARTIAETP